MLWRNKQKKDTIDDREKSEPLEETLAGEESAVEETVAISEEENKMPIEDGDISDQGENVQKVFEGVKTLIKTIDQIKEKTDALRTIETPTVNSEEIDASENLSMDDPAVKAAEEAVLRKEKEEELLAQKRREKELQLQRERAEAKRLIAMKKQEAIQKKQQQREAEKRAAALERNRRKAAAEEEMRRVRELYANMEEKRQRKKKQDAEERLKERQAALDNSRAQKRAEALSKRNEALQKKAMAQQKRQERQKVIKEQRDIQRKAREEAIAEIRRIKLEQERKRRAERKAYKTELKRQKKIARKSAEMGGGIVNVHGTTVSTEVIPVGTFSLKDLLGIITRKEKKRAGSTEELQALRREKERKREEAREIAARLTALKRTKFQGSAFGMQYMSFKSFCDRRKKELLTGFSVLLIVAVCIAGVLNFLTVYEYSYNGHALGYVKDKKDVVQITGLVQNALTEDKNYEVIIDAKDDIDFRRVRDFNRNLPVDNSDKVLKRLTYMGDLNVKAYGIYIDGKKVGTVENKDAAANVLQDIKDRYSSKKKGSRIEEAVIVEAIEIKKINSDLQNIQSENQMVDTLCTSGEKESTHTVVVGETLADIARDYGTTEKELMKTNKNVNPKKLVVGSTLAIKQTAPVMTVKITEVRTYDKTIKYEVEEKKDKDMYEGYSEIDQEGRNGKGTLTDRTISINGEVVETENLKNKVEKEPVTKIVRVGTKERPPTVGSGTYIWPANSGTYTVTSEFKWRWGRQHQGLDLGCPTGTSVFATDGGTVTYASYMGGYGNLVIIDHQNGMESYYAHNSSLLVSVGDKVYQGQQIARSGNTGRSTGPHIHFGIKDHGTFQNPRNYLP